METGSDNTFTIFYAMLDGKKILIPFTTTEFSLFHCDTILIQVACSSLIPNSSQNLCIFFSQILHYFKPNNSGKNIKNSCRLDSRKIPSSQSQQCTFNKLPHPAIPTTCILWVIFYITSSFCVCFSWQREAQSYYSHVLLNPPLHFWIHLARWTAAILNHTMVPELSRIKMIIGMGKKLKFKINPCYSSVIKQNGTVEEKLAKENSFTWFLSTKRCTVFHFFAKYTIFRQTVIFLSLFPGKTYYLS